MALAVRFIVGMLLVLTAQDASAYIGPGAGLSAIGSLLALVLAVVVAIFGFFWYPIKRMLKKRKGGQNDSDGAK